MPLSSLHRTMSSLRNVVLLSILPTLQIWVCRPPLAELDTKYYKDVETALYAAGLLDFEVLRFDAKIPVLAAGEHAKMNLTA